MHNTHLSALESKHKQLDRKIHDETLRPFPDQTRLGELKRRKLKVKEEMVTL